MKVVKISPRSILFEGGFQLTCVHERECCEQHYLDFDQISLLDFEGLDFDIFSCNFIRKIPGYGIGLCDNNGR